MAMGPVMLTRKPDIRTGNIYQSIYFITFSLPCLNMYKDLFYKDKLKVKPENLDRLLTARGLACWTMDDGGKSSYNQTFIHTRSFSKNEIFNIQIVYNKNFYLTTRIE